MSLKQASIYADLLSLSKYFRPGVEHKCSVILLNFNRFALVQHCCTSEAKFSLYLRGMMSHATELHCHYVMGIISRFRDALGIMWMVHNIVKLRVLSNSLVYSWISLRNVKRGPWDRVCDGLIHPPPDTFFWAYNCYLRLCEGQ